MNGRKSKSKTVETSTASITHLPHRALFHYIKGVEDADWILRGRIGPRPNYLKAYEEFLAAHKGKSAEDLAQEYGADRFFASSRNL